jgi:hypothetical protein
MQFQVDFSSPKKTHIIEHLGTPGLDMLDILREKFPKLKNLSLNKVHVYTECPVTRNTFSLNLTETQARQSAHFNGQTHINVKVPEAFFTQFVDWEYREEREKYMGHVSRFFKGYLKRIGLNQVLDVKILFDAWAVEGFPTQWKIEEKKERVTTPLQVEDHDSNDHC